MTNEQIANHIREIAINQYKKKNQMPYEEENCIYYISGNFCELENTTCCICTDKIILKEGEEINVKEEYSLKRKDGKIIKENKIKYLTYNKK